MSSWDKMDIVSVVDHSQISPRCKNCKNKLVCVVRSFGYAEEGDPFEEGECLSFVCGICGYPQSSDPGEL
jgi:hypothetical protein